MSSSQNPEDKQPEDKQPEKEHTYDERFMSHISTWMKTLSSFDPTVYFSEYHFYEKYEKTKNYQSTEYEYDYGHGLHTYHLELYTITFEDTQESVSYALAKEKPTPEELKTLGKYCDCEYCKLKWYNVSKYFTCPCCVGCVKSIFPSQQSINKARKRQKLM